MKRFFFEILGLFLLCQCQNQTAPKLPSHEVGKVQITQKNGILFVQNKPYSGTLFALFPNQKDTLFIQNYQAGKEHGVWKQFYNAHQVHEIRYFENGQKVGKYVAWWENGKPKLAYHFEKGEYQGICQEWNPQGTLVKEMHYEKGHEEGSQKVWYDNGKIRSNYVIKNGRRYGLLGTKNCKNVSDSVFVK